MAARIVTCQHCICNSSSEVWTILFFSLSLLPPCLELSCISLHSVGGSFHVSHVNSLEILSSFF